jgi:hypothetical protein
MSTMADGIDDVADQYSNVDCPIGRRRESTDYQLELTAATETD